MKYDVQWSKTYHVNGNIEVDAKSKKEAEKKVLETIGDLEASMQYNPDKDSVEAYWDEESIANQLEIIRWVGINREGYLDAIDAIITSEVVDSETKHRQILGEYNDI